MAHPVLGQGGRFFLVALAGLAIDVAIASALALGGLPLAAAAATGFAAGLAFNYFAHAIFTFRQPRGHASLRQMGTFLLASLAVLGVRLVVLALLERALPASLQHPTLLILLATGASFVANFLVLRGIVFAGAALGSRPQSTWSAPGSPRRETRHARRRADPRGGSGAMMNRLPLARIALFAALTLALCWPAILNRGPIFFFDSVGYFANALTGVEAVLDVRLGLEPQQDKISEETRPAPGSEPRLVVGGRSVYYGIPLVLSSLIFDFRLVIVLQAALAAAAIMLFLRRMVRRALMAALIAGGVLAVLSPLPFFVSYLMPDVLTGIVILALAVLLSSERRMSRAERWFWFAALLFGLLAHLSHLLIAAVLLCGTLLRFLGSSSGMRASAWFRGRGPALVAAAMLAAVVGEAAQGLAVKHFYDAELVRPPFLTARLVEDGPGYAYLRDTCPESGFEMCNHLSGSRQDALSILWSHEAGAGVFRRADPAGQVALYREEFRLLWQTVLHEPLWSLQTFAQNLAEQAVSFRLDEFAYTDGLRESLAKLPADEAERARQTVLYRGSLPLETFGYLIVVAAALSLAAVAFALLLAPGSWSGAGPAARRFRPSSPSLAGFVILGLLANAAVTGILSGPFDRYQARVIWLLPLLAVVLVWRRWVEGRPPPHAHLARPRASSEIGRPTHADGHRQAERPASEECSPWGEPASASEPQRTRPIHSALG